MDKDISISDTYSEINLSEGSDTWSMYFPANNSGKTKNWTVSIASAPNGCTVSSPSSFTVSQPSLPTTEYYSYEVTVGVARVDNSPRKQEGGRFKWSVTMANETYSGYGTCDLASSEVDGSSPTSGESSFGFTGPIGYTKPVPSISDANDGTYNFRVTGLIGVS